VFLGRVVPPHDELQKRFEELEKKTPKRYEAKLLSRDVVERLEDLRASTRRFREIEGDSSQLPKDFLVRFTYNSNAIEGNPLTLRQTALILADGVTPQGAKTKDVMEVLNGKDAWEFIKAYRGVANKGFVCRIQFELVKNTGCRIQGNYRDSQVGITGSNWKLPAAKEVAALLKAVFKEYRLEKRSSHPVELASWLHNRVAQIHPFTDGNGRTARLLMNWVLLRNGFPPVVIEARNKEEYYRVIESADEGKQKPFNDFLAKQLLQQYTILKPEETVGESAG
jgi:Fic family protein